MQLQPVSPLKPIASFADFLNRDARHYQISFHSIFLITGLIVLGWHLSIMNVILTFSACLLTQYIFILRNKLPLHGLKSAAISASGICLMFRSDATEIYILAAVLSIVSKFIFHYKGKHFFNPSNFGICLTVLITQQGWISPGQWGSSGTWWFLIGIFGFIVVTKAKRLDTAFAFIITFAALHFIRIVIYQNWPIDAWLHLFNNGSLLVFTFFMITDPASTPSNKIARMTWAAAVAALAFWLQSFEWITGSPLWALFFLSPLTPFIDRIARGEKFTWTNGHALTNNLKK